MHSETSICGKGTCGYAWDRNVTFWNMQCDIFIFLRWTTLPTLSMRLLCTVIPRRRRLLYAPSPEANWDTTGVKALITLLKIPTIGFVRIKAEKITVWRQASRTFPGIYQRYGTAAIPLLPLPPARTRFPRPRRLSKCPVRQEVLFTRLTTSLYRLRPAIILRFSWHLSAFCVNFPISDGKQTRHLACLKSPKKNCLPESIM